ncbi:conjugative transposon protein TraM [Salinimicrobium sp. TIG7-5_MAKvit]|uniref:conjugative transposon protein TraM n=1 Tax=Salinimicrobium sp. TIG7-5_MAKvit TaxID=3121289 RepID=UPI003C6E37F1
MKPDKKKIVFVCIIIIVLLFIGSYSMLISMDQEVSESLQQPLIPHLEEEQETYSSKIEAVDAIKEERERNIPNVYTERYLDSLDAYTPAIEQEQREWVIDSTVLIGIVRQNNNQNVPEVLNDDKTISEDTALSRKIRLEDLSAGHANFFLSAVTAKVTDDPGSDLQVEFQAEVNGTQVLRSGDRLELISIEDFHIGEKIIPKNSLLYGFVRLHVNRIHIEITHVEGTPIKLKAFDHQDSNEGIYIKNSFRAEAGKEVLDDLVQGVNISGFPQIGGVKNLFRKSNRNLKVTILDQYQLLLKTEK